jgi:hypothetical protein
LIEHGGISPDSLKLLFRAVSASRGSELIPLILENLPESERLESYAPMMMEQAMEVEDCDLIDFLLSKGIHIVNADVRRAFERKHAPFLDFLVERGLARSVGSDGLFVMEALAIGDRKRAKKLIADGAIITPELIHQRRECLVTVITRHDEKALDLLLGCHPDLSKDWSLIPVVISQMCSPARRQISIKAREAFMRIIERLIEAGAPIQGPREHDGIGLAVYHADLSVLGLFDKHNVAWTTAEYGYEFSNLRNPDIPTAVRFVEERGAKAAPAPSMERGLIRVLRAANTDELFNFLLRRVTDADIEHSGSLAWDDRGAIMAAMRRDKYDCAEKLLARGFRMASGANLCRAWAVARGDPKGIELADRLMRLFPSDSD